MPDYKCSNCGKEYNWFDGSVKKEGKYKYCSECNEPLINIKTGELLGVPHMDSQLPKEGESLVCAFQRKFNNPYRVQCALTGIGGGAGFMSRTFANYEPCLIDICPIYQAWKKEK